jgi:hypothetical protein
MAQGPGSEGSCQDSSELGGHGAIILPSQSAEWSKLKGDSGNSTDVTLFPLWKETRIQRVFFYSKVLRKESA